MHLPSLYTSRFQFEPGHNWVDDSIPVRVYCTQKVSNLRRRRKQAPECQVSPPGNLRFPFPSVFFFLSKKILIYAILGERGVGDGVGTRLRFAFLVFLELKSNHLLSEKYSISRLMI